ncbi:arrestin domain-containing protein 2-like isoform X2 [Pomacea canaliculata]|uniref:arrestin domain-containing protein 2-like isoform X2 n=1 Tax=Pomacea canaliculata TaxID=400727 RepID=UPI000D728829|nr:arrestin domain-containing protein 2-like isoform X2 [Pomacea canaliculata]
MAAPTASIELNLEHQDLVFYSGDRIRGALVVHLSTAVTIAGVELRFRGAARAKWREYVNEGVRRTEIEHEKEEIYFDDRFCLWGKVTEEGRWESREVLKRGRHLFPFQYKLPDGIPCSFEGPEASVRYTVHGLLARTSGSDMTTQRHVTVLRDLDSKRDAEKRTPSPRHALEDHAERAFSSTCCRPGRVSCSLSVMKRSYVPGEHIKADVQLSNNSVRKSGPCRLQLKQLLTYGETFTRALLLQEVKLHDCIKPGQRRQWHDVTLRVPPTCPSRLSKCRVIDVRYCVAVEAAFSDAVLYAAVPVTIVTIPERGIIPIRWSYKECSTTVDGIQSADGAVAKDVFDECDFRPKYKFFEEVRDSRKDRFLILKLRQSPGVRRRQLMGLSEPGGGECRTDAADAVGDSQA